MGADDGHWYALDTRRTLVYKIAFHPDQEIPIHAVPFNRVVELKMSSHRWSHMRACSVFFCNRLHKVVPHGVQDLPFIRNRSELLSHVVRVPSLEHDHECVAESADFDHLQSDGVGRASPCM